MGRAALHLAALLVLPLGGCAIDWKVPEQVADGGGGAAGSGGSGGGGGAGTESPASSSSATGGATVCDASTSCSECLTCAPGPECGSQYGACATDPDCYAIAMCVISDCADLDPTSTCIDLCVTAHAAGEALFDEALVCVACQVCPTACAAIASWACST